ncbi:putative uncharacterized protein DDB_G0291812 [Hetaerina americana]|uniref:putative uncharacterized protein DDB_G0291812 n=1 Tax=Hetaerina americana TaxID=62018 RepID=UPI003A7F29BD
MKGQDSILRKKNINSPQNPVVQSTSTIPSTYSISSNPSQKDVKNRAFRILDRQKPYYKRTNSVVGAESKPHKRQNQEIISDRRNDFPFVPSLASIPSEKDMIFHNLYKAIQKMMVPIRGDVNTLPNKEIKPSSKEKKIPFSPSSDSLSENEESIVNICNRTSFDHKITCEYENTGPGLSEWATSKPESCNASSDDESCEELERKIKALLTSTSSSSLVDEDSLQGGSEMINDKQNNDSLKKCAFYWKHSRNKIPPMKPLINLAPDSYEENTKNEVDHKSSPKNNHMRGKICHSRSSITSGFTLKSMDKSENGQFLTLSSKRAKNKHQGKIKSESSHQVRPLVKDDSELTRSKIFRQVGKNNPGDTKSNNDIVESQPNLEKIKNSALIYIPPHIEHYIRTYINNDAQDEKRMYLKEVIAELACTFHWPKRSIHPENKHQHLPTVNENYSNGPQMKSTEIHGSDENNRGMLSHRLLRRQTKFDNDNNNYDNKISLPKVPFKFAFEPKPADSFQKAKETKQEHSKVDIKIHDSESQTDPNTPSSPPYTGNGINENRYQFRLPRMTDGVPITYSKPWKNKDLAKVLNQEMDDVDISSVNPRKKNSLEQRNLVLHSHSGENMALQENSKIQINTFEPQVKKDMKQKKKSQNNSDSHGLTSKNDQYYFKIEDIIIKQVMSPMGYYEDHDNLPANGREDPVDENEDILSQNDTNRVERQLDSLDTSEMENDAKKTNDNLENNMAPDTLGSEDDFLKSEGNNEKKMNDAHLDTREYEPLTNQLTTEYSLVEENERKNKAAPIEGDTNDQSLSKSLEEGPYPEALMEQSNSITKMITESLERTREFQENQQHALSTDNNKSESVIKNNDSHQDGVEYNEKCHTDEINEQEDSLKFTANNNTDIAVREIVTGEPSAQKSSDTLTESSMLPKLLQHSQSIVKRNSYTGTTQSIFPSEIKNRQRMSAEAGMDIYNKNKNNRKSDTSEVLKSILPTQPLTSSIRVNGITNDALNEGLFEEAPQSVSVIRGNGNSETNGKSMQASTTIKFENNRSLEPIEEEKTLGSEESMHHIQPSDEKETDVEDMYCVEAVKSQEHEQRRSSYTKKPKKSLNGHFLRSKNLQDGSQKISDTSSKDTIANIPQDLQSRACTKESNIKVLIGAFM